MHLRAPDFGTTLGRRADHAGLAHRWATEAYRLLKPGGYLLAFGGTRTVHRLASAIEDAGFEIRDCLVWGYASGFPKSLNVSKAIDKAAGVLPDRVTENENGSLGGLGNVGWNGTPRQLHYGPSDH